MTSYSRSCARRIMSSPTWPTRHGRVLRYLRYGFRRLLRLRQPCLLLLTLLPLFRLSIRFLCRQVWCLVRHPDHSSGCTLLPPLSCLVDSPTLRACHCFPLVILIVAVGYIDVRLFLFALTVFLVASTAAATSTVPPASSTSTTPSATIRSSITVISSVSAAAAAAAAAAASGVRVSNTPASRGVVV